MYGQRGHWRVVVPEVMMEWQSNSGVDEMNAHMETVHTDRCAIGDR